MEYICMLLEIGSLQRKVDHARQKIGHVKSNDLTSAAQHCQGRQK